MSEQGEITRMLTELSPDGRDGLDRVLPLVYEELRRIAHRRLRDERSGHTLATADLVHEAYLKLLGLDHIQWKGRAQFFALAAQAMRRILVDYAVRRKAQKRGGERRQVPLDQVTLTVDDSAEELLALDDALGRLALLNERYARVVECRYFAGMDIGETAEALEVSPATVKRDWTLARAWLHRALSE